jgi:uncharacterized protein (DUF433 family)
MVLEIKTDPVPLRVDEGGAVRVGNTRISLYTVVSLFQQGASAEEIVLRFPSLNLADVHSVLGYYLRHQAEVDSYMADYEHEAEQIEQQVEARWPSAGLRQRLVERLAASEGSPGVGKDAQAGD